VPTVREPAHEIPVIDQVDICVVGGSCTGVFAAVRAARLGASVALVERDNCFGGTATSGLVCVWHSRFDTTYSRPVIGGLTAEVIDRLRRRDAVELRDRSADCGCVFNPQELKLELDELVREHPRIHPRLHCLGCVMLPGADGRASHVMIEDKGGRGAIAAQVVIDASGDGDLAARHGLPFTLDEHLQPPTTCALIRGLDGLRVGDLYNRRCADFDLPPDSGWSIGLPGGHGIRMHADTHVFGVDVSDPVQLTAAEMAGRRSIRALMEMVQAECPERRDELCLLALASAIGARESRRFRTRHRLTEVEVLTGHRFPDAIAQGTYRVDIHHPAGGGCLFRYLDGREVDLRAGGRTERRWRDPLPQDPVCYHIPYRTMVTTAAPNLILAGRMIGCDRGAFGAVRVMVNLNQVGEAAGVAAVLAARHGQPVAEVDAGELRRTLNEGGSLLLDG
jgi:hypothetical protein